MRCCVIDGRSTAQSVMRICALRIVSGRLLASSSALMFKPSYKWLKKSGVRCTRSSPDFLV